MIGMQELDRAFDLEFRVPYFIDDRHAAAADERGDRPEPMRTGFFASGRTIESGSWSMDAILDLMMIFGSGIFSDINNRENTA